jgi:acetyl esterase/lipase
MLLRARDEGLPLPTAAVLMTPVADLTESGDSHQVNLGLDPLIPGRARGSFELYSGGQDLSHPYLSPLNGDFSRGFPPAILTTGTRDMLLSDTVLLHRALRRAGIPAELHVTEAAGHGGFLGMAPEDQDILREVRQFADLHWNRERR